MIDKLILIQLAVSQGVKRCSCFPFFDARRKVVSQVVLPAVDSVGVEDDLVGLVLVSDDGVAAGAAAEGVLLTAETLLVLRRDVDCLVINFLILTRALQFIHGHGLVGHVCIVTHLFTWLVLRLHGRHLLFQELVVELR